MTNQQQNRAKALQALVACSIALYRLEELGRIGMFVQNDKNQLNRTINMLVKKERTFLQLDNAVNLDALIDDLERYIESVASLDSSRYNTLSEAIENDSMSLDKVVKRVFNDIRKGKTIVEASEINQLQKQLEKYL